MKLSKTTLQTIQVFAPELGGVFTFNDFKVMFPVEYNNTFYRLIASLEKLGIVSKPEPKELQSGLDGLIDEVELVGLDIKMKTAISELVKNKL